MSIMVDSTSRQTFLLQHFNTNYWHCRVFLVVWWCCLVHSSRILPTRRSAHNKPTVFVSKNKPLIYGLHLKYFFQKFSFCQKLRKIQSITKSRLNKTSSLVKRYSNNGAYEKRKKRRSGTKPVEAQKTTFKARSQLQEVTVSSCSQMARRKTWRGRVPSLIN